MPRRGRRTRNRPRPRPNVRYRPPTSGPGWGGVLFVGAVAYGLYLLFTGPVTSVRTEP